MMIVMALEENRKYQFSWDETVGMDPGASRPCLGPLARVEVYRLLQYSLRDVLEQHWGAGTAETLLREAGALAGRAFCERFLTGAGELPELFSRIQRSFAELGIGIFRVETVRTGEDYFVFTLEEDVNCSGLPDRPGVICVYNEGFIQGILESSRGRGFEVREIDFWHTGARTCRFEAKPRLP
jgi:predicted hydrocarbon binding protein